MEKFCDCITHSFKYIGLDKRKGKKKDELKIKNNINSK